MTTDWRALCVELLDCLEKADWPHKQKHVFQQWIYIARRALAEPDGPAVSDDREPVSDHPITPSPELVQQWLGEFFGCNVSGELSDSERYLATQAARWSADQELEACCEYMQHEDFHGFAKELRAARRPKPPSLKDQANSISFQEGSEVIRIDAKGFHYHGQFIEDAGEAHRLLVEFLRKHQPDSDWHHAE